MANIFISHSVADEDKPLVDRCTESLKASGISFYLAELNYEPKPLTDKIKQNIAISDFVLILQTRKGAISAWIQQEAAIAHTFGKPIIIILEKGVDVKGVLQGIEYISFDRDHPDPAFQKVTEYVQKTASRSRILANRRSDRFGRTHRSIFRNQRLKVV